MSDFERHNLAAIDFLNQRGGRMLSLVDLLAAGTLSLDMAAATKHAPSKLGARLHARKCTRRVRAKSRHLPNPTMHRAISRRALRITCGSLV